MPNPAEIAASHTREAARYAEHAEQCKALGVPAADSLRMMAEHIHRADLCRVDIIAARLPAHLRRDFRTAMFTRGWATVSQALARLAGRSGALGSAVAEAMGTYGE